MAEHVPPEYARTGCAFCNRKATLTLEHVWPQWMGKMLRKHQGGKVRVTNQRGRDGIVVNQWKAASPNLEARIVCASCNGGWMSDLESAAQRVLCPILLGQTAEFFSSKQAKILASYAIQKAIIADWMNEYPRLFFSRAERNSFGRDGISPVGMQAWIGKMVRVQGILNGQRFDGKTESQSPYEIQAALFGFGYVVFSAVRFRWGSRSLRRRQPPPEISLDRTYASAFLPLWPVTRAFAWPPIRGLTDVGLAHFANNYWTTVGLADGLP